MTVNAEVDIDIDDIIDDLSQEEKEELYEELGNELGKETEKSRKSQKEVINHLENISYYDLKKILCLLLNVPSYHDEKTLRERLEPIITAK